MHFKARSEQRLADPRLQKNLSKLSSKFTGLRTIAIKQLDDFEGVRLAAVERRNRAIKHLDAWLDVFEEQATARGAKVLWAESAADAAKIVVAIAQHHGVKKVTKTKSMVSEEMELNRALAMADIEPVETDLGEYILQINNNEAPSHIIAPVVHKDKEEIADLFARVHGRPRLTEIPAMTAEAREVLRAHFLTSDMGVTGGNFIVAETGSVAIITNEGNEGMCTLLPKVHVVVTGIEKVVPTLEDLTTLVRLLPRSATGQSISNYFSLLTGTKAANEQNGVEHMYFVLVDAGRSNLIGSEFQDMLRCIRCGACMNHCPVYQKIGGHSYGWVYPGPMGSVLTPNYVGLKNALDLPQAATLCGECEVVCPVKIPLPDLMRKLREQQVERRLRPWRELIALRLFRYVATRPGLYRKVTSYAAWTLARMGGKRRLVHHLPFGRGWTAQRDLPAPAGQTFVNEFRKRTGPRDD